RTGKSLSPESDERPDRRAERSTEQPRGSAAAARAARGAREQTFGPGRHARVAARERQRLARHLLRLLRVAFVELDLAELEPEPGIVRIDAYRPLDRRRRGRVAAGGALAAALLEQRGRG